MIMQYWKKKILLFIVAISAGLILLIYRKSVAQFTFSLIFHIFYWCFLFAKSMETRKYYMLHRKNKNRYF